MKVSKDPITSLASLISYSGVWLSLTDRARDVLPFLSWRVTLVARDP